MTTYDEYETRIDELEDALCDLLDGLDSNTDEAGGLTEKEWEKRISDARAILDYSWR